MNIKDVAAKAGLPAKTIRYYEEIGLITPLRQDNGYRHFREGDLHKLAFIGRARSLGFTIEECRALLALYEDRARASAEAPGDPAGAAEDGQAHRGGGRRARRQGSRRDRQRGA